MLYSLRKKLEEIIKEEENCIKLKQVLIDLSSDAINCKSKLQSIHGNLSMGLSIAGFNGFDNILSKSSTIADLIANTEKAISEIEKRIIVLTREMQDIKNKIRLEEERLRKKRLIGKEKE